MEQNLYDVLVLKEYETKKEGQSLKRKAWNKVGKAWRGNKEDSLNFELYLMPNQNFYIRLQSKFDPNQIHL